MIYYKFLGALKILNWLSTNHLLNWWCKVFLWPLPFFLGFLTFRSLQSEILLGKGDCLSQVWGLNCKQSSIDHPRPAIWIATKYFYFWAIDIVIQAGIQTRVLPWLQSVERLHVALDHLANTAGRIVVMLEQHF